MPVIPKGGFDLARYTIHTTKQCNNQCVYCYEKDKTSTYTWEEIKGSLDKIINSNDKIVEVEFIGGEPLLRFDLVKRATSYLNKYIDVLTYYITTGGTVLDADIIEYLKQNENVIFGISMDGNKFMNQLRITKEGINTYDIVMDNFDVLKAHIDIDRIMFHMTIHPWNVGYLSDGIRHLYNRGVRFIDLGIIEKTMPVDEEFKQIYIEQNKIISDAIIQGLYDGLKYAPFLSPPILDRKEYKKKDGKVVLEIRGDVDMESTHSRGLKGYIYNLKNKVYRNHRRMILNENAQCRN